MTGDSTNAASAVNPAHDIRADAATPATLAASMRIAIGGIAHEALTFAPIQATLADFDVWRGAEVLEFPGVADAVDHLRFEPVPLLVAQSHTPGGPVERATYLDLRRQILDALRAAGALGAVGVLFAG